jgi:hypothetical protein
LSAINAFTWAPIGPLRSIEADPDENRCFKSSQLQRYCRNCRMTRIAVQYILVQKVDFRGKNLRNSCPGTLRNCYGSQAMASLSGGDYYTIEVLTDPNNLRGLMNVKTLNRRRAR